MPNSFGRLLDDDDFPPPHSSDAARAWTRVSVNQPPPLEPMRSLPAPSARPEPPPLRSAQRACYEALGLALKEGHVFAAMTGPEGSGKTTVLEAVIVDRRDRALRCIRISEPEKVPASLAAQIEQVAYAEASKPENLERHVVLAVDDAHTASEDLLRCLVRLATMREPGRRVPQIILAGRPELWNRLAADEYEPLVRRLAIRAVLPAAEEDVDPWASLEQEVTRTMDQMRAEAELLMPSQAERDVAPDYSRHYAGYEDGHDPLGDVALNDEVAPPSMYALFPEPPPVQTRSPARETRRRLLVPIAGLFIGITAFALVLSFYDWPDLLGDMPWSDKKPDPGFVLSASPQSLSHGLPLPPPLSSGPPSRAEDASPDVQPAVAPPLAGAPAFTTPTAPPKPPLEDPSFSMPSRAATVDARQPATSPSQIAADTSPAAAADLASPTADPAKPAQASTPDSSTAGGTPVVTAPSVAAMARPAAGSSVPVAAGSRPAVHPGTPVSSSMVTLLLRRGDEQAAIGDLSAARSFYERAAEAGSASGARQVGRSFDVGYLSPADAGMADAEAARSWYARAAALGDKDAAARLKVLKDGR